MPFAELLLWYYLRGKHLNGYKFRRQVSIGPFIVDFYCPRTHVAIEIDGDSHVTPSAVTYDVRRQAYLQSLGMTVLRFTNTDIYHNRDAVLDSIVRHLPSPPLTPPS
ncbi:MAG: hypothetical protein G01um101431_907 [Parcubacteria group bacterium Gr01-1014_31]|nr:MAG: hypothetical protein G01um101431_907 [Parcubacteria group bacterium Gr01-1014_31]